MIDYTLGHSRKRGVGGRRMHIYQAANTVYIKMMGGHVLWGERMRKKRIYNNQSKFEVR